MRVWQRLAAAPDGPRDVVHAGRLALYVDLDGTAGGCVGLVARTASRVPCALWSNLSDLHGLAQHPVHVSGGTLVVGDVAVRFARVVDVRAPAPQSWGPPGRHAGRSSEGPPAMTSGLDRLLPDVVLPADGRLTPGDVARLVGRGPGLTPLGDDVLAGWLAVRAAAGASDHAVSSAVRRALPATTSLSATLLDCALHGEALPELAAWVAALGSPGEASAESALLRVGASSGAGLLAGARLALRSIDPPTTAPSTTAPSTIGHPGRVA